MKQFKLKNIFFKIKFLFQKNNINRKNCNFSVIASTCNGTFVLHDYHIKYNSPFINLWIEPSDFIKLLKNLKYYMNSSLVFVERHPSGYPIGMLGGDVKIHFMHYKDEKQSLAKWNERTKRINYNNLYIMFTDRDGCTFENLKEFDKLPYKNKVVFTHLPYKEIKSSFYIKGFEQENSVGLLSDYIPGTNKRYLYKFNFYNWFTKSN